MTDRRGPICLACELSGTFDVEAVYVATRCPDGRDGCLVVHWSPQCPRCGTMVRSATSP